MNYTLFNDTYVMYQLLEFIDENGIIMLCKTSKKLNEICKQYIELEDDKRFEAIGTEEYWVNSYLLENYCQNNDVIKIRKMIKMNLNLYWEWGLHGACQGGHIDIVKLMIEKGGKNWDWGLSGACRNGHFDIVKLMITKQVTNYNWGLENACNGRHIDIVNLMIEKGATKCGWCFKSIEKHLKKVNIEFNIL